MRNEQRVISKKWFYVIEKYARKHSFETRVTSCAVECQAYLEHAVCDGHAIARILESDGCWVGSTQSGEKTKNITK